MKRHGTAAFVLLAAGALSACDRAGAETAAMPDMGVSDPDGRDIAAYLYTLR